MRGVSVGGGHAPGGRDGRTGDDRGGRDEEAPDGDSRDDRALLAAHLAGDDEAFATLFRRHRDRLWAVALRTVADREEAADALQDAMISAFRRAGAYRGDAAVTTWLHRIVVNACLDRIRRRKVRAAEPLPDDLEEYANRATLATSTAHGSPASGGTADPAEAVLDGERRDEVFRALDTLPPEQRAALVLVDMQGYSVLEAAEVLECAPGTVKSRCSRGRTRLAPLLSGLLAREPDRPTDRPSTRTGTPALRPETGEPPAREGDEEASTASGPASGATGGGEQA